MTRFVFSSETRITTAYSWSTQWSLDHWSATQLQRKGSRGVAR